MRVLWIVLVAGLAACYGSGQAPAPQQGKWAKFVGSIAGDVQGSSVNSCAVNVLSMENSVLTSHYHQPKVECDCSTVQPEQAANCVGEQLNSDDTYLVSATVSSLLLRVMRLSSPCSAVMDVSGIPFIPPDCLATVDGLNRFTSIPVVKFPRFVPGADPASKALDINAAAIVSSKPYITREGEKAYSVLYKSLETSYDGCELDAEIVFAIDDFGHLVPARQPSALTAEVNPAELNLVPLEYHLSSELSQNCKVSAGVSDNANSEGIDNALSPYAGLDIEYEFGPLYEGVLTLDYEERFYKVK